MADLVGNWPDLARGFCASCLVFATRALAQQSVDELRNNYNFLQSGLSTLAAGASVALCLARGRLDSEMGMADFFTMTRFRTQNEYGSVASLVGNNGSIIGVYVGQRNDNEVKWAAHNTWAQGNLTTLVPFQSGPPTPPPTQPPTGEPIERCECWHIPSLAALGTGRGLAALHQVEFVNTRCYRVPSYQCGLHGKTHLPELHERIEREIARGTPLDAALEGPSQLVQWMLDANQFGDQYAYFFGVDKLGSRTLARMVGESLVTLDAMEKGRTSDLVDWSLGRLELSEKPDVKWKGSASTVVLVSAFEILLMLVLALVFGLDPFVSSLGARRGVRSLRLGAGGVTNFADLWLLEVKGFNIEGWDTPVLRVKPRKSLRLWYYDAVLKSLGLAVVFAFWIATVFGYVHPLGLTKSGLWENEGMWATYVGSIGALVGLITCGRARSSLDQTVPMLRREKGFGMANCCMVECVLEVGLTMARVAPKLRTMRWLRRCWFVMMEGGVWLQWFTAKRAFRTGPHSDSGGIAPALTLLQAGALVRATILAAVSGTWTSH